MIFNKLSIIKKLSFLRYLCFILAGIGLEVSFAQTEEYTAPVEEILITGERSLHLIRQEVIEAENDVFDLFNEIYKDTDYEMICKMERQIKNPLNPTANSWPKRVCRSKYAHELHEQAMRDYGEYIFMEDSGEIGTPLDTIVYETETTEHAEDLYEKVRELLIANPEYREKFRDYAELKTKYDSAVAADFDQGNFFTRLFKRNE